MDSQKVNNKKGRPSIAIACGGSGGHLFPGVALAEEFADFNIQTELFTTSKKVDDAGPKHLAQYKAMHLETAYVLFCIV